MSNLRSAAQQALKALAGYRRHIGDTQPCDAEIALLDALAQEAPAKGAWHDGVLEGQLRERERWLAQQEEPVWMHPWPPVRAQQDEPQTLNDALTPPRAMAQAYENGYKAGVAHEREACAQVCEARFMGDLTREDMEARRCAAAIRARGDRP